MSKTPKNKGRPPREELAERLRENLRRRKRQARARAAAARGKDDASAG